MLSRSGPDTYCTVADTSYTSYTIKSSKVLGIRSLSTGKSPRRTAVRKSQAPSNDNISSILGDGDDRLQYIVHALIKTFTAANPRYENRFPKMSFESLNARISALQETTKHVSILIERLRKLDFQPGSLPLDLNDNEEEGNVVVELSQEIKESLREETETRELLEQEVRDFPGGKQGSHAGLLKEGLEHILSKAQRDIAQSNASFRDAILIAKKNLAAAQELERSLIMEACKSPELPPITPNQTSPITPTFRQITRSSRTFTAEEKEIAASSDVTAALRRTHNIMLAELSKSQFANQTLEESTAALAELSEKYSTLETLLAGSKNLLNTLLKSQKSDTWYLETAFYVLVATIAWLIFRRLLYGPMWWMVWLPLKMFYRAWMSVFAALGMRGTSNVNSGAISGGGVKMVQDERPSLKVHNQATGAPKVDGQAGRNQPMVRVGGGGRGAPMRNLHPVEPQLLEPQPPVENTMVEEVGKIIDADKNDVDSKPDVEEPAVSREEPGDAAQGLVVEEQAAEEQEEIIPNPKKRMWDAEVERKRQEKVEWNKDEL